MPQTIIIPDGDDTPRETSAPGERFVVASGSSTMTTGAPAVTLSEDDSELQNAGQITTEGAPAARVTGDRAYVQNGSNPGDPALIKSDLTAIEVVGRDANLVNAGTLSGDFNGLSFVNGGNSSGQLVNEGLITSLSRAVNIGGTDVVLINDGRIETTADPRDGVVYTDYTAENWTILNGPHGVIDGPEGGNATAISLQLGTVTTGLVVNDGVIQGRGEGNGIGLFSGVEGGSRFEGLIDNTGHILSEATAGIQAAVLVEPHVDFAGKLVNSGLISGDWNGVYFTAGDHSDGIVYNEAHGRIESASRAVNIDGSGLELVNEGTIATTSDARNGVVYSNATADHFKIKNLETGVIGADEGVNADAISLEIVGKVNAEIFNEGLVAGRGEAALSGQASGVRLFAPGDDATFKGYIANKGTISTEAETGISAAVLVEDGVNFLGEIANYGLISGPRNGIYVGNAAHELLIYNNAEGIIESDSRAVNIDGTGVELKNEGLIRGTGDARNGVIYADDTADDYSILNYGTIDAGEQLNGDSVSLQLGAHVTAEVVNHGLIQGRGVPAQAGQASGLRLFSGADDGSVFFGDILNSGTIGSETGAAILIEEKVALQGTIVNTGTLAGHFALDASTTEEGLRFIQEAGVSDGHLRFGSGNDRVTISGGEVTGKIELGDGRDFFNAKGAHSGVHVDGGKGSDRIIGSDFDDVLSGGGGPLDILTGSGGADIFLFGPDLVDNGRRDILRITDFEAGIDTFDFGDAAIARQTVVGNRLVVQFAGEDRDLAIFDGITNPADVGLDQLLVVAAAEP